MTSSTPWQMGPLIGLVDTQMILSKSPGFGLISLSLTMMEPTALVQVPACIKAKVHMELAGKPIPATPVHMTSITFANYYDDNREQI